MADIKISALPGASTLTGAETIPLVQGGTTKKVTTDQFLIKDASGNVGVGTASPACRLNIAGYSSATTAPDLLIQRTSTGVGIQSGPNITFQDDSDGTRTVSVQNTQGRFGVWNYNAGWKERLCVDNAGNLGLGVVPKTSTGSYKAFEIGAAGNLSAVVSGVGTTLNSNTFVAAGAIQTYAVTGAAATYELGSGTHAWYTAPSGTAGNPISFTQAMTLDASGALGIGTAAPSSTLHVVAVGDNSVIRVGSSTAGRAEWFAQAITGTAITGSLGAYPYAIWTNGAERARINASGNLLVGTTSVTPARSNLAGVAIVTGGNMSEMTGIGGPAFAVNRSTNDGDVQRFYRDGTQVGSVSVTSTTATYNTSSDARLKENIAAADNGSALIDGLQVRQFDWKADGSHQRFGFVAQELDAVYPEAVSKPADPDEMMGVDYSKLVPLLVQEIQSLRARLAAAGI